LITLKSVVYIIIISIIILSVYSINIVVSFWHVINCWCSFNGCSLRWFLLLIFLKFGLHVRNSVGVEFAFDCGGCFNYIEVSQEVIKLNHALFEVIDTYWTIIVKIESHPSSWNIDVNKTIGLSYIVLHLLLLGCNYVDVWGHRFGGGIIQKENMLDQRPELVIYKCEKILTMICNHSKFIF